MSEIKKEQILCSDCEAAIIAGIAGSDPAVQKHLQQCAACREFAEFQAMVLSAELPSAKQAPEYAQIKGALRQHNRLRQNYLRFIVMPTAAAAAAVLAVTGVFWHMGTEKTPPALVEYTIFADSQAFAAALDESTITLAWDQVSSRAAECSASIDAVRQTGDWSIEVFNPINEDLL